MEMTADSETPRGPDPNGGVPAPAPTKRDTGEESDGPASKRLKLDPEESARPDSQPQVDDRRKGVAPVKPEYVAQEHIFSRGIAFAHAVLLGISSVRHLLRTS